MLRGKARERSGIQVTTNWEWLPSRQNFGIQGAFLSSTSSTGWIMTWIRMISVQFTVKFCFTIADALNTWCFIFLTVFCLTLLNFPYLYPAFIDEYFFQGRVHGRLLHCNLVLWTWLHPDLQRGEKIRCRVRTHHAHNHQDKSILLELGQKDIC